MWEGSGVVLGEPGDVGKMSHVGTAELMLT